MSTVVAVREDQIPRCEVHPRDNAVGEFRTNTSRTASLCGLCGRVHGVEQLTRFVPVRSE